MATDIRGPQAEGFNAVTSPQIAMRPDGPAIAIWSQADDEMSSIWAAHFINGRWTAPKMIGIAGPIWSIYSPLDVAVDPNGAAVAVWTSWPFSESGEESAVYASRFVAGAGWDVPTKVGPGWGPKVGMDSSGNALVVWTESLPREQISDQQKMRLWANRFVSGTGWGIPTLIEPERGGYATLTVDAEGNAVVGWWCEDYCASTSTHVPMVSRYTPVRGWEAPTILEGYSHTVKVVMSPDGGAFALWSYFKVSRYVPDNGWEPPTGLLGAQEEVAGPADVAVGGEGSAIAAWTSRHMTSDGDPSDQPQVHASRFALEVGWQVPVVISGESDTVIARYVLGTAMTPEGDGVVVWTEYDGAWTSVWANHYARSGGWGAAEVISELVPTNDANVDFYPEAGEVAMDREGHFIAIWVQSSGGRADIWANRLLPLTLGDLGERLEDTNRGLVAVDLKIFVLIAIQVGLAAAAAVLFLAYGTMRRRVRAQGEVASEGQNRGPGDRNGGLANKGTDSRRGGATPPPPWRRWPANSTEVRLTAKERTLLHLLDFSRHLNATEFPPELTSTGIAMAVGIDGRHVAQYLRPLVKEGLVLEKTARVRGALQRRKVYMLDAEGWRSATGIRERVLFLSVRLRDESGDRQATVAEILAATHGHRKILDVVREATEMGFVTLSAR